MLPYPDDTICAVTTPPGRGAVAMIRISGPEAFAVAGRIFAKDGGRRTAVGSLPSHTVHHGIISDRDEIIDDVLITLFRTPHSYTGEDVIEISTHGSVYIQQRVIRLLLKQGIRLARPGEFTLRAFLNGKFDLSQAEAVADLIDADSASSHNLALRQLRGGFSDSIRTLRGKLLEFAALIELELDFSEEHAEFVSRPELIVLLDELEMTLDGLIRSFTYGNAIKQGIPVAIAGKTNVGKSTLLNAILNEERAIVSEIPGTTRDAIEDTIVIGGYTFRFIDTAGLRETRDEIELIGIGKTREKIRDASILLYLFDASVETWQDVAEATAEFSAWLEDRSRKLILVGNKTDLVSELPHGFRNFVEHETVFVSAKRKENIHLLAETLVQAAGLDQISDQAMTSNIRHLEALQRSADSIRRVKQGIMDGISPDLLTADIRNALYHLGEITGEITTDEILGAIFSRFCIGK